MVDSRGPGTERSAREAGQHRAIVSSTVPVRRGVESRGVRGLPIGYWCGTYDNCLTVRGPAVMDSVAVSVGVLRPSLWSIIRPYMMEFRDEVGDSRPAERLPRAASGVSGFSRRQFAVCRVVSRCRRLSWKRDAFRAPLAGHSSTP